MNRQRQLLAMDGEKMTEWPCERSEPDLLRRQVERIDAECD